MAKITGERPNYPRSCKKKVLTQIMGLPKVKNVMADGSIHKLRQNYFRLCYSRWKGGYFRAAVCTRYDVTRGNSLCCK